MRIIYLMGKSASGKDTIYKKLKEHLHVKEAVLYTTRPMRENEIDGREYFFISEEDTQRLEAAGKVIEKRVYNTAYGKWTYMTVDDGQFKEDGCYMAIGTLESYKSFKKYFGAAVMVPVYIEVEDGLRLERALARERLEKEPRYDEMCRRFLADQEDFSEENLKEAEIKERFSNEDLETCTEKILGFLNKSCEFSDTFWTIS